MGEATIPPSRRRLARAHQAGFRPRSRYLEAGVLVFVFVAALQALGPVFEARFVAAAASLFAGRGEVMTIVPLFTAGFAVTLALAVVGVVLSQLVSARIGVRRRGVLPHPPPLESADAPLFAATLLAVVAAILAIWVGSRAIAGAARSVDATEPILAELWTTWAWRLPAAMGLVMLVLGTMELALARTRLWWALHLDPRSALDSSQGRR